MGEQRSNQAEEALEDLESQLEDAQAVANQDLSRTLSLTKRLNKNFSYQKDAFKDNKLTKIKLISNTRMQIEN